MNAQTKTIHERLIELTDKSVTVENRANEDTNPNALMIQLHGSLEDYTGHFEPGVACFLVRVKESYEGTSSICFPPSRVTSIEDHPSGKVTIFVR